MFEVAIGAFVTTVTISGALDLATRDHFTEVAARVSSVKQRLLTFDLCDVTFLDSSGAAFLISLAEAGHRKGWITVLRGCSANARFVLEICDAVSLFRFDDEHVCPGSVLSSSAAGLAAPAPTERTASADQA